MDDSVMAEAMRLLEPEPSHSMTTDIPALRESSQFWFLQAKQKKPSACR